MSHSKTLIGATVEDLHFSLNRHAWTGMGERFETYPEAFDAAVDFFEEAPHMHSVVIETRVKFRYPEDSAFGSGSLECNIESETLSRTEAERRAKLRRPV